MQCPVVNSHGFDSVEGYVPGGIAGGLNLNASLMFTMGAW